MSPDFKIIDEFYRATHAADGQRLVAVLHPDFVGQFAPGLPMGAGGRHEGPMAALSAGWAVVHEHFEIVPFPETREQTTDGTLVVTGHYRGTARSTGRSIEAEFVHLWRVTDGRISWLHQYTDTQRWHDALNPE